MTATKKADALYIHLSFFTQQPGSKMRSFFIFAITTLLLAWGGFRVGFDPVAYRCRRLTLPSLTTVHVLGLCPNPPTDGRWMPIFQSPQPPASSGGSLAGWRQTNGFV